MAKNGQNLAFLCNKSKNLQATMLLLGAPRVFGTREYVHTLKSIANHETFMLEFSFWNSFWCCTIIIIKYLYTAVSLPSHYALKKLRKQRNLSIFWIFHWIAEPATVINIFVTFLCFRRHVKTCLFKAFLTVYEALVFLWENC